MPHCCFEWCLFVFMILYLTWVMIFRSILVIDGWATITIYTLDFSFGGFVMYFWWIRWFLIGYLSFIWEFRDVSLTKVVFERTIDIFYEASIWSIIYYPIPFDRYMYFSINFADWQQNITPIIVKPTIKYFLNWSSPISLSTLLLFWSSIWGSIFRFCNLASRIKAIMFISLDWRGFGDIESSITSFLCIDNANLGRFCRRGWWSALASRKIIYRWLCFWTLLGITEYLPRPHFSSSA